MVVPPSPTARLSQMWLLRVEAEHLGMRDLHLPDRDELDQALRVDLVDGLLQALAEGAPDALEGRNLRVVLHRPGSTEPHEDDQRWLGAARTALAARDLRGDFLVEVGQSSQVLATDLG